MERRVPSGSASDELKIDADVGAKSKGAAIANLEQIMAERLDALVQAQGKQFFGSMFSSMISLLTKQVGSLAEAQERTGTQLEKVSARPSQEQERMTAAASRENKTRRGALSAYVRDPGHGRDLEARPAHRCRGRIVGRLGALRWQRSRAQERSGYRRRARCLAAPSGPPSRAD